MLIHELKLQGLLSFGPDSPPLELRRLNVLIGPNGSGKSNLLEAVGLLRSAPKDLSAPVKETGGVGDWLWNGGRERAAVIEAVLDNPARKEMPIRHHVTFAEHGSRFEITREVIENRDARGSHDKPYAFYRMEGGYPRLFESTTPTSRGGRDRAEADDQGKERDLPRDKVNPEESILSQIKDPERYPILAQLADSYSRIRLYREWSFGRYTAPRLPQKADLRTDYLSENCENLGLVLNALRPRARHAIMEGLNHLYPGIDEFGVRIESGWVQLFLQEGESSIPATRLSDGTLRYLCLLAILCHPDPPPLVCIEEPELGLHPDVLPHLAELLVDASDRCQLIITTHSDLLIDALTAYPESVITFEKHDGTTRTRRLDGNDLKKWLADYRLGELWLKGQFGGTRW